MKVMHVAECIGGVERYLKCLLKYSTCDNIMVLSQLYIDKKEEFNKLAKHVEIMQMNHGIDLSALDEAIKLRKLIKQYKPNIVYAHSSIAGAITRIACIGLSVKIVYNPHGWSFNMEGNKKKLFVNLERIMSHFCHAIICISEAEKKSALREKICKEENLHIIYNGIDIEGYTEETLKMPLLESEFVVGMVGRICKQKAPDIFVKMASIVQKQVKNARFIIVGDVIEGDSNERKSIEALAEKLGVKLLITGWVENPMVYMRRFDVGCLLSRWEGFGLVIPEYMLTKTPIIATRIDAIPYLISDKENGILVEKDDWKSAAKEVIELSCNNEKRERLIQKGMDTVRKRFDVRRVSSECENLYKELLK